MITNEEIQAKFQKLFPIFNEKQRRIFAATEAQSLKHGGIIRIARITGMSRTTIYAGIRDIEKNATEITSKKIRAAGGGRKTIKHHQPDIEKQIELLIEPNIKGDPMTPLLWTCKSVRNLAEALVTKGFKISHMSVKKILQVMGYSLKGNKKNIAEIKSHPDRNEQFEYISTMSEKMLTIDNPVISVDTKKKEQVGNYKNNGKEWKPKGKPDEVFIHDFIINGSGKAIPYGIYDQGKNLGWVNVGCDNDTAKFAVASIRNWWKDIGSKMYRGKKEILICADAGGSNGYKIKQWKTELQKFANKTGLNITVCHFPPGTSKWNKIEHRLFSQITLNWRGKPLISYDTIIKLIASVKTKSGLRVKAKLDTKKYPTKIVISEEKLKRVNLFPHIFHGEWNYTIKPYKK